MTNREVFVPLLSWLIGGSRIGGSYNTYIGSMGTDALTGCFNRDILNYRIYIEKLEETEIIKCDIYYGMTCYESQPESAIETQIYELSEQSLPLIKAWIESKLE